MWTRFRRSGKSAINGQRSTSPFWNALSELVPVSTHFNLTPARFAASFTVSTARPVKPLSVRIWTGGLSSKPMRRGRCGSGGRRVVKYQSAGAATTAAAKKIAFPCLNQPEIGSTLMARFCPDTASETFSSDPRNLWSSPHDDGTHSLPDCDLEEISINTTAQSKKTSEL